MLRQRSGASSSSSRQSYRQTMRRVIIKQGYLKKLPNSAKIGSSFKKPDRRWFVFGVMNDTDPYLEYYENEEGIFANQAINIFFLDQCHYIVKNQSNNRYSNIFTLVMRDRHLSLVATSRQMMYEWCRAIEVKLTELGIMETGENIYTLNTASLPSGHHSLASPPSPTSPTSQMVPMTPMTPPASSTPSSRAASNHTTPYSPLPPTPPPDPSEQSPGDATEPATGVFFTLDDSNDNSTLVANQSSSQARRELFSNDSDSMEPPAYTAPLPRHNSITVTSPIRSLSNNSDASIPPIPERRFSTPAFSASYDSPPLSPYPFPEVFEDAETPRGPTSLPTSPVSPTSQFSLLPEKMREALGLNEDFAGRDNNAVSGWNMPPPDDRAAPPPYMGRNILEKGANRSLKMSQVQQLNAEMNMEGGIKVRLRKIDCHHTLALVDVFGGVWIAGWNQQARPYLHTAFHIGDKIISINGQVVENSKMANRLIKNCGHRDKITFIMKRVPHAKVFALKRTLDGEGLGFRREGGTAEIVYVDPVGLAAQEGLTNKTTTLESQDFCNWWLTEINHRPLNLFFKEEEIEKRLNAVGRDISFMVQPLDFINNMKTQLKAYKNYKDFLVQ